MNEEKKLLEQEEQSNDPSLIWPSPAAIVKLPEDWAAQGRGSGATETNSSEVRDDAISSTSSHSRKKKKRSLQSKNENKASCITNIHPNNSNESNQNKQPYYLNHVRGSTRIRQASQRIAAAMGTLVSSYLLCSYSSLVTLDDIGLGVSSTKRMLSDFTHGFAIGSFIVIFIFIVELRMGWIRVIGFRETVVPTEVFAINIAWDILFHLGVSINEEVMYVIV